MTSSIPLRRYLSLQFGIIAASPVIVIAFLFWLFLMPQMRADVGIKQRALARAISGQISAHLMGGQRQLMALSKYVESLGPHPATGLFSLLDTQCGEGELFETIYIAGPDETIYSLGLSHKRRSNRNDLLGLDLSGRAFYHEARMTQVSTWSETFLSTASSHLAVALAIPLAERMIIGEITLGQLSEFISHLPAGAELLTIVLDRNGRVVADSRKLLRGQQLNLDMMTQSTPQVNRGAEARLVSTPFELNGQRLIGTVVEIETLGWRVLVAQPIHKAYGPLKAAFIMSAMGLAVTLALVLVLAWFRAGNLSRLFQLYAGHAQCIAQGNYDLEWPTSKTEEFAQLGQNLDVMAKRISQREREIVANETQLRITLNSIGDAVIATDKNGAITRMNPMAEQLTGWSLETAAGQPLAEVFHIVNAYTRQEVANPVKKVLATGEIVGLANHTMLISKDGREYQVSDSGAPIRHPDGRIVGVVLVFRDVTESYVKDQRIRENEKMLKDITANVPGVVYQVEFDRKREYANAYVSEKAEELIGLDIKPETFYADFLTHLPEHDRQSFAASIREAVDHVKPWQYEGKLIKPDGEEMWFSTSATTHKKNDTVVLYGVLIDITENKQLEESLRLTQFCFDKASIGIFRIGDEGQILDVNEQACLSLGYSKKELCNLTVFDIDPNSSSEIWPDHIQNLRKIKTRSIETQHKRKNGDLIPVQILINVMTFEGQEFRIAYVQDISERKKAEKETQRLESALLQAQKMEAIGTLAGGIAHDFNNILSAVIGYTELSLWNTDRDAPVYQNLRKILTAGMRARDLVEQILTFSRKAERELKPLQVGPLVKEALKLLRSSLPTTIEIAQEIDDHTDNVMADPTQIHQIIINLCTNAAHAMDTGGGQMKISLSQVKLSEHDIRLHPGLNPGDYLKLAVQDTGTGIPADIIAKIYDPYFTTKQKGKGTGLGLAVVHGIVKGYGGAIFVYSESPGGTTFNIYLPTVKGETALQTIPPHTLPRGTEHILIVDDEALLIDVLQQMLENLGYRVSATNDGKTALEMYCRKPDAFDLVLTDMTMPKMTGDELASELLKINADLPIILCTGYSAKISAETALRMGIRAFIYKPIVEIDLANIVRNVLDGVP